MAKSADVQKATADRDAIIAGLDELLKGHSLTGDTCNRYEYNGRTHISVYDLPPALALTIARWLASQGLRHSGEAADRIEFSRRKAGVAVSIQLIVDDSNAIVQAAADAALTLRALMAAGDTDTAIDKFGLSAVLNHQEGKLGKAYEAVALSALYQAQGASFGMLTRFDDKPHTLTLATLLTDAARRGEVATRGGPQYLSRLACIALRTHPELVEVAATLDQDLPNQAPEGPATTPEGPTPRAIAVHTTNAVTSRSR